jgi:spore cortex biosynthesis protein YabQ
MSPAIPLKQEFMVLLVILAAGFLTGALFDLARVAGKIFLIHRSIIFLVDLLLCLAASLAVYQFLFSFNQGEVRFYVYLAFFLGIVFYYLFYSPHLYKSMLLNLKYILRLWLKAKTVFSMRRAACRNFFNKMGKPGE